MSSKLEATEMQKKLLNSLKLQGKMVHDLDYTILSIFCEVYGVRVFEDTRPTPRQMQQKLGGLIARTNARLKRKGKSYQIVPGKTKQTYRVKFSK